jgi:hypothetical protein
MIPRRFRLPFVAAACAAFLTACGGGADGEKDGTPTQPPGGSQPSDPTSPGTPPSAEGPAADCFDAARYKPGATFTASYSMTGAVKGSAQMAGSVGSLMNFEGNADVAPDSVTIVLRTDGLPDVTTVETRYRKVDGMDITEYGTRIRTTDAGGRTTETLTLFQPPPRNKQFSLLPGGTWEVAYDEITKDADTGKVTKVPTRLVTRYVGQESLATAAGTFDTCKFEISGGGTMWLLKRVGVTAKLVSSVGGVVTELSARPTVDGKPL